MRIDYTTDKIEENKSKFTELLTSALECRGVNTERVLKFLEESDFFEAPASTRFHNCIRGGLCAHSLNVYESLKSIVAVNGYEDTIKEDSIIIVSLLHDVSKRNYYERYMKNQKLYTPDGSKYDDGGRFDWQAVPGYKVREFKNRFIYSDHEASSEYMVSKLVPLSLEESAAILHHHGTASKDSDGNLISDVFNRFPLACMLHLADVNSTFILERDDSHDE